MLPWLPPDHWLQGADAIESIRLLYEKYFVLQSDIQTEIDAFRAENFDANPVFAVHVRSLDKGREDPEFLRDNADMLPVLDAALAEDPKLRLFLMTDSETVLEQYAGRYGDRVFNTDCARTEGIIPLTWQDTDARHRLGVEVIKDTYLAASCDRFIGYGGSSVACMVACLKRWPEGACTLLGDNIKIRRNWLLHDW
ncbi:MAG: O-fucosyltransferase family protein [Rhodospirillaceae bacterium]|nr:O-fucosyltransferase family protein [Rhodospirillaceae bacterium]